MYKDNSFFLKMLKSFVKLLFGSWKCSYKLLCPQTGSQFLGALIYE